MFTSPRQRPHPLHGRGSLEPRQVPRHLPTAGPSQALYAQSDGTPRRSPPRASSRRPSPPNWPRADLLLSVLKHPEHSDQSWLDHYKRAGREKVDYIIRNLEKATKAKAQKQAAPVPSSSKAKRPREPSPSSSSSSSSDESDSPRPRNLTKRAKYTDEQRSLLVDMLESGERNGLLRTKVYAALEAKVRSLSKALWGFVGARQLTTRASNSSRNTPPSPGRRTTATTAPRSTTPSKPGPRRAGRMTFRSPKRAPKRRSPRTRRRRGAERRWARARRGRGRHSC